MGNKAMLIDVTKCIGCRSCQVSCKSWNNLDNNKTSFTNNMTNPPQTDGQTYTVVDFMDVEKGGKPAWRFIKRMCMHCLEPACKSACFAKAFDQRAGGAVVYEKRTCVGCRYCMIACPWWMLKYEWDKVFPAIVKCKYCFDLIEHGKEPVCVTSCPTAIDFGDRDEMIAMAKKRIADNPDKYVDYVYGEHEAGGTNVLYLSDVPFEDLGLPMDVPKEPLPNLTWKALTKVPYLAGGVGLTMTALYLYNSRKNDVTSAENDKKAGGKA
ncbi:formate dehydrogenase iron-sulfur subunit [Desulfitispora alkaliphila]|uniref:4Fe-4S dicluster domain-containing protein n=1 Tax=Desulfitispora alkaliphila TaxID=622674 RepID=UPI003D19114C